MSRTSISRSSSSDTYEILAFRYATHKNRTRFDNFMSADDHARPEPIDYFVWIIHNADRTILVDTGMDHAEAKTRNRIIDIEPAKMLAQAGFDPAKIETVIVSHLHYDHAGTFDAFPNAHFHIQEAEVAYATGPCMCDEFMRKPFTVDHVCSFVKKIYSGRVAFHNGDGQVAPGITVHKAAGHTQGLQCVRVKTADGYVVLASDATHMYENFERRKPFSITVDAAATLRTYTRLIELASSHGQVIPGHDPLVLKRYPAWKPETQNLIHRLDLPRLDLK